MNLLNNKDLFYEICEYLETKDILKLELLSKFHLNLIRNENKLWDKEYIWSNKLIRPNFTRITVWNELNDLIKEFKNVKHLDIFNCDNVSYENIKDLPLEYVFLSSEFKDINKLHNIKTLKTIEYLYTFELLELKDLKNINLIIPRYMINNYTDNQFLDICLRNNIKITYLDLD